MAESIAKNDIIKNVITSYSIHYTKLYENEMTAEKLIIEAIDIIGGAAPLNFDCGTLCDRACCVGEGYMMVFPGEMNLLRITSYNVCYTKLLREL